MLGRTLLSAWSAMVLGLALCVAAPASAQPGGRKTPATQPANGGNANAKATPRVAWIELAGPLPDAPPALAWVDPARGRPTLQRLVKEIRRVSTDPKTLGMVVYLDQPELSLTQIDELEAAIRDVRASKKKVLFFAEAYDLKSYLLACSGDQILLQRKGQLELTGLGIEEMYLAGLLEKIGAKADFLQVGKFKGADEQLTRVGPSAEWSQNFDALLDDLYSQITTRIAKARKLDAKEVETAFADCWAMTDTQYVKRKLVDRLTDRDMTDALTVAFGEDFDFNDPFERQPTQVPMDNPFAMMKLLMQQPRVANKRASIAIINATGAIHSGGSGGGSEAGLFGGPSIGSRTICHALEEARDDAMIKGVIIRLDSPGGSALASEIIWQAIRDTRQKKPVYVSIDSMAASGGYYMASACDKIYVSPASIVGSIGVVGGKIVLAGTYEKVGIKIHRRARGPMGDMFNSVEPFTPEQRTALLEAFKHTYEQFLDRVSIGRGKKIKDLPAVAEGRLFTGAKAVELGMADKVGGIDSAIGDLAKELNLKPGGYDLINLPPPISLPEFLEDMFGGMAQSPAPVDSASLEVVRVGLGKQGWNALRTTFQGVTLLRNEHVILMMPTAIVVR